MSFSRRDQPREEELAALADGSLPEDRREALEAQVAESPELAALLAEQQSALALVRGAAHERKRRRRRFAFRRPLTFAAGFAGALAAAVLLVLTLPSGAGGPSLAEAATLATRPSTAAAPQPLPSDPKLLDASVEGVRFPTWLEEFGWRTAGARVDTIDGREATTVFYEKQGKRIASTCARSPSMAARS
jgi:anti-sigma factor RsiW